MYDFFKVFVNNVLDYLDEGVCFIDLNKNILYWNTGAAKITGYSAEEAILRKCCRILTHSGETGKQLCDEHCPITATAQEGQLQEAFMFILHKEGNLIPVTIRTFPVYDQTGQLTGFIELISDNSRQKLRQEKVTALTKAAYIDSLSELFSKQYIETTLQTMLQESPEKRKPFSILYININGFRSINELHGVSRADKVFKLAAKRLSSGITSPDIIGRWHGASFIAIVNTVNKSLLLLLVDKLKRLIAESDFTVNEEAIHISISVGYTIAQNYDTLDYLIERVTKTAIEEKEPMSSGEAPVAMPAPSNTKPKDKPTIRFHSNINNR